MKSALGNLIPINPSGGLLMVRTLSSLELAIGSPCSQGERGVALSMGKTVPAERRVSHLAK